MYNEIRWRAGGGLFGFGKEIWFQERFLLAQDLRPMANVFGNPVRMGNNVSHTHTHREREIARRMRSKAK